MFKPTKETFLREYRAALVAEYAWASNTTKLDNFMRSVSCSIYTPNTVWDSNSPTARRVYRQMGGPGRYSVKALRALPSNAPTGTTTDPISVNT